MYLQGLLFREGVAGVSSHAVGVLPQVVQLLAQGMHQLLCPLLLLCQLTALLLCFSQLAPAQNMHWTLLHATASCNLHNAEDVTWLSAVTLSASAEVNVVLDCHWTLFHTTVVTLLQPMCRPKLHG